ncbi:TraR/DksA family transcriptional regulator [Actinobacillus pleuropneumoniae]|uniref:TraR/DksA family transcriptional regulator n=1 Tax=Actinobacillus pleuropneumoniae TaxID=715 RepID=UPI002021211F|nr:TraR/DksA family transcriptional regulator [Actinobacillus pleuropneumoniae]MCL7726144.1 TraR/DksA family transcriptional regulator [Actinobacillus pleuropneumoniae]MCL7737350.1 TraR/DksA family transcriptional regulator [Actinobacillus pleuropneumoniae]
MPDFLDRISEREEQILEMQLAPRLDAELSDDDVEAIAQAGRECSECGLPIPTARLRANPKAHRCMSCQQDWEDGR